MAWTKKGSIKGPKGETGSKGGSVRVANIDVQSNTDVAFSALSPSDGVQVGDVIIDSKGDVYTVATLDSANSTAHVGQAIEGVTLKGPKGDTGETGAKGADGTSITVKGAVADNTKLPSDAAIGDTYVTSADGHMWVKTAATGDNQWTDLGEMKGPKGDTGATGANGKDGSSCTTGSGAPTGTAVTGSVYIDAATGDVYSYTA